MAFLSACRRGLRVACLLAGAMAAAGARPAPTEREVEAAFLCSFAEFVEWPNARAGSPVHILVLGDDPFGPVLDEMLRDRPLRTKPIEVRRSRRAEDARGFEVVYVSASERGRLAEILAALADDSVLTVSDVAGFAGKGGIIGFFIENRRVRFEINPRAAERAKLRISSRLLNLARIVEAPGPSGRP